MTRIAFIGTGDMGSLMAGRLLAAGHEVTVWNRTRERTAPLAEAGASVADTPAAAVGAAEAILTMVADAQALDAVTADIAAASPQGSTVIQMATVGTDALSRFASALPGGVELLDAPVLGSLPEAEAGSLRIFAGGPAELVERWTPLLSALGTVLHVGAVCAGTAAKLVVNSTLFGAIGVLGEAIALADSLELGRGATFEVLAATPLAAQAERRRPAIESGEYPRRFSLALALKDANLIRDESDAELRLADAARSWLGDAEEGGWSDRDYSAVLAWILGDR